MIYNYLTFTNILIYIFLINILTFAIFYLDKKAARNNDYRIPEASLLCLTFLGGTFGAIIAMKKFRHKTKKGSFRVKFLVTIIAQILFFLYLIMQVLGIKF